LPAYAVRRMMPQAEKKLFKVKYFSGALSHGAKLQSDAYIKNYVDIRTIHFLGAFSWVQEVFSYFTIEFVDFTLKNFSGLLHLTMVDRNCRR
jgi:hypothetical protein